MASLGAPNLERLLIVFATGDDETLSWMPIDALDIRSVSAQNFLFQTSIKVPYTDGPIVRASCKLCVRRAPAKVWITVTEREWLAISTSSE